MKGILRLLGFKVMDPPPPSWRQYRDAKIAIKVRDTGDVWIVADPMGFAYLADLFRVIAAQSQENFDHVHIGPELELAEGSASVVVSKWTDKA
jgi:hypothetical protein